jgi:hypothetical protein
MSPRKRVLARLMGARRRVGVGLLAGALLVWIGGEALGLRWLPLLVGVAYLAAAWAGGPKQGPWGPACVLLGWGAAFLAVRHGWVDEPEAPVLVVGIGVGLAAAALLRERGHQVGLGGTSLAVLLAGLASLLADDVDALRRPVTYAVAIAAYGVLNLLNARVTRR